MPNRLTHARITTLVTIATSLLDIAIGSGALLTMPISIFGRHLYLNPDADIVGSGPYKIEVPHRYGLRRSHWHGVIKRPWKILLMSHVPAVGTIIRFLPVAIVLFSVGAFSVPSIIYLKIYLGMVISDTAHVCADLIVSGVLNGTK